MKLTRSVESATTRSPVIRTPSLGKCDQIRARMPTPQMANVNRAIAAMQCQPIFDYERRQDDLNAGRFGPARSSQATSPR